MIKLNDTDNKSDIALKLKNMLDNLESKIDSLNKMETGTNISTRPSAYDVVLTAEFNDTSGLDAYRTHPEHVKVLNYLKEVMDKATVVDYQLQ